MSTRTHQPNDVNPVNTNHDTIICDYTKDTVEYPAQSLTRRNFIKNLIAFRVLKALGFAVLPTCDNSAKGGVLYFSASAMPLRWKSSIEA